MSPNDPDAPGALSRWVGRVGLALVAASLAALAVLWAWDRIRHREVPRFEAARFVALDLAAERPATERWVVAVNPACPRCRHVFPAIAARRARTAPAGVLEVLLVDVARRPAHETLADFPASAAWWDSAGVWRHAWGHRVYGEVLRFRSDGTLLGIDPPPPAE